VAFDRREARLQILDHEAGDRGSRTEPPPCAAHHQAEDQPDKIRDVIGKGGVVIRGIRKGPVPPSNRGRRQIAIACVSAEGGEAAKKRILDITADVEVGKIYEGPVLRLLDFGAIIQLPPGRDGLLHISHQPRRVNAVSDHPEGRPDREGGCSGRRQGAACGCR
jgi:polyribonucleotide nucleotidyltransferase